MPAVRKKALNTSFLDDDSEELLNVSPEIMEKGFKSGGLDVSLVDDNPKPQPKARQRRTKPYESPTHSVTKTYLDFLSLPASKVPKKILQYLVDNVVLMNDEWIVFLDSADLVEATGKSAAYNSKTILKLQKEGWFEIRSSSSNGSRIILLNPETYNLVLNLH